MRLIELKVKREHRQFIADELAQCNKIIPMLEALSGEVEPLSIYHADKRVKRLE